MVASRWPWRARPGAGGGHEPLDLVDNEVLAWPARGVGQPAWRHIPIYGHWCGLVHPRARPCFAGPGIAHSPIIS